MREAIIEKLSKHLSAPPSGEADVVYALVQIRKLMERDKVSSNYPRLKFFCDWVVRPRWTPENRPLMDTSKAANGAEPGQE